MHTTQPAVRAADVAGPEPARRRCKIGRLLDQADDDGRELLKRRMCEWPDAKLAARLKFAVGATTIFRHRTGICICGTEQNA